MYLYARQDLRPSGFLGGKESGGGDRAIQEKTRRGFWGQLTGTRTEKRDLRKYIDRSTIF